MWNTARVNDHPPSGQWQSRVRFPVSECGVPSHLFPTLISSFVLFSFSSSPRRRLKCVFSFFFFGPTSADLELDIYRSAMVRVRPATPTHFRGRTENRPQTGKSFSPRDQLVSLINRSFRGEPKVARLRDITATAPSSCGILLCQRIIFGTFVTSYCGRVFRAHGHSGRQSI